MKEGRFLSGSIRYGTLVLVLMMVLFSCTGGGSGSEDEGLPAVVGAQEGGVSLTDSDLLTEGIQYIFYFIGDPFTIQLKLDTSITASETVLFRSSLPLPSYLDLDLDTGIITVDPDGAEHTDTVYFWSEGDSSGDDTSAQSLRIDFIAESS